VEHAPVPAAEPAPAQSWAMPSSSAPETPSYDHHMSSSDHDDHNS
jgi:hypothetical protein